MKKLYIVIMFFMVCAMNAQASEEFFVPPEDFDKLNANAEEKFTVEYSKDKTTGCYIANIGWGRTKPYPGKPEDAALMFLKQYHIMLKISGDLREIRHSRGGNSPGHLSHIVYQQYYKGIPVAMSEIMVRIDTQNRVIRASSTIKEIKDFNVEPVIQAGELQQLLEQNYPQYGPIMTLFGLRIEFYNGLPFLAYQLSTGPGKDHDKKKAMLSIDANTGEILKSMGTFPDHYDDKADQTKKDSPERDKTGMQTNNLRYSGTLELHHGVPAGDRKPMTIHNPPSSELYRDTKPGGQPEATSRIMSDEEAAIARQKRKDIHINSELKGRKRSRQEVEAILKKAGPQNVKRYSPPTMPSKEEQMRAREEQHGIPQKKKTHKKRSSVVITTDTGSYTTIDPEQPIQPKPE